MAVDKPKVPKSHTPTPEPRDVPANARFAAAQLNIPTTSKARAMFKQTDEDKGETTDDKLPF